MASGLVTGAYSIASSSGTSLVVLCVTQEECSKSHCLGHAIPHSHRNHVARE